MLKSVLCFKKFLKKIIAGHFKGKNAIKKICSTPHNSCALCLHLPGSPLHWVSPGRFSTSFSFDWSNHLAFLVQHLSPTPSSFFSLSRYLNLVLLHHCSRTLCAFVGSITLSLSQMVSLANEVRSFHVERQKEVSSFTKSSAVGGLSEEPSLYSILSYSYCYVGIMTGESVAPPPSRRSGPVSILSVVLLFAFAWNLTTVSLCLTLLHLSDIVWVHIVFSLICSHSWTLCSSPITSQKSLSNLYRSVRCLQLFHFFLDRRLLNAPLSHPAILPKGPFFRFQTYADWLKQPNPQKLPGWVPCLQRLKLVPVYGALFVAVNSKFPLDYVRTGDFLEQHFFFRCHFTRHFLSYCCFICAFKKKPLMGWCQRFAWC